MKARRISKIPEFGETLRIHGDPSGLYTLEIPEYGFRRISFATPEFAFDAALAEVDRRRALANEDALEQIAIAKKDVAGIHKERGQLLARVADLSAAITRNREFIAGMEAATSESVSNDSIADGDPTQLEDDAILVKGSLNKWFGGDNPIGTMGLRWPYKDADRDGDMDHGLVMYPSRQPNLDF